MVSQLSITKQSRGGRVGSSETITSWLILTLHDLPGFLQSILRVAIKRNFINKYDWSFHSLANMFSIAACDVVILRKIYVVFVPFPDTDSLKPLDFLSDKSNKSERGAPLVVQWLKIHFQCRRRTSIPGPGMAAKSMCHNCRASAPQLLKPVCLEPVLCHKKSHHKKRSHHKESSPCSPQLEKARVQQWRSSAAKHK